MSFTVVPILNLNLHARTVIPSASSPSKTSQIGCSRTQSSKISASTIGTAFIKRSTPSCPSTMQMHGGILIPYGRERSRRHPRPSMAIRIAREHVHVDGHALTCLRDVRVSRAHCYRRGGNSILPSRIISITRRRSIAILVTSEISPRSMT